MPGTELNRKERAAGTAIETAKSEVNVTLGLTTYSADGLLIAVNDSRQILGGGPLDVQESNRFKEGIAPPGASDTEPTSANFNLLQQAIQTIRLEAPTGAVPDLEMSDQNLRNGITELRDNPDLFAELERLELTQHASRFVDDSTVECPVCGAPWLQGNLKGHLDAKIATAHAAEVVRKGISESAEAIAKPTRTLRANISALTEGLRTAVVGARDPDLQSLDAWLKSLSALLVGVTEPVERYLDSGLSSDDTVRLFVPEALGDLLDRIEKALQDALPKPTPEQTAWDKLTRLEESVRILGNRT